MKKIFFLFSLISSIFWVLFAQTSPPIYPEASSVMRREKFDVSLRISPAAWIKNQNYKGTGEAFALVRSDTDAVGNIHSRMQQYFNGYPVWGGEYILHSKHNVLVSANGRVWEGLKMDLSEIQISEKVAFAKACTHLSSKKYAWQIPEYESALQESTGDTQATFLPKPELWLVPVDPVSHKSAFRLAWRLDIFSIEPLYKEVIYIDASSGEKVLSIPQIQYCYVPAMGKAAYQRGYVPMGTDICTGVGGQYRLFDSISNVHTYTALGIPAFPPSEIFNASKIWDTDTAAIAAHWASAAFFAYVKEQFSWVGFDNKTNTKRYIWVHFGAGPGSDQPFHNAFWNGIGIACGDGNGKPYVSMDIIAHEWMHGIIKHTCNLISVGEPGALNEGLCDAFACLFEQSRSLKPGNWTVGEDINLKGFRKNDFPQNLSCPSVYGGKFWKNPDDLAFDNGGIHYNSTVMGKLAYILSNGEKSVNEQGFAYDIPALGHEKTANLLFHTMRFYLTSLAGFEDMRQAMLNAAGDPITRIPPSMLPKIEEAWCAVGIGCNGDNQSHITLKTPNGGESFYHGQSVQAQWTASQSVEKVRLWLSIDGGWSWKLLLDSLPNTGIASFVVPNVESRLCRIRVSDLKYPSNFDLSDAVFNISGCGLFTYFTTNANQVCQGQKITAFNAEASNPTIRFQWLYDDKLIPGAPAEIIINTAVPGKHKLTLTAESTTGNCRDTFEMELEVLSRPNANFKIQIYGSSVSAVADFVSGDTYLWIWNGQKQEGNQPYLNLENITQGTYNLCLTVLDACGNEAAQECREVKVEKDAGCVGEADVWQQFNNTSKINDAAQYKDKLIVSTTGGLLIYDKNTGNVVKRISPVNSALPCIETGSIAVDSARGWAYVAVKNKNGLVKIDLATYEMTHFTTWNLPELLSDDISVMKTGPDGDLWIGTANLGIWKGVPGVSFNQIYTSAQGLPNTSIVDIDFGGKGETWVAMPFHVAKIEKNTVTAVYSSANSPLASGPANSVNTLYIDNETLWVGTSNKGLLKLEKGAWTSYNTASNNLPSNYITTIRKGNNGKLYFGLYLNSYLMEYDGNSFKTYSNLYSLIPYPERVIKVMPEGTGLWLVCRHGMYFWNGTNEWRPANLSEVPIDGNELRDVLVKKDDTVYLAHKNSVVKIKNGQATSVDIAPYLPFGPSFLPYLDLKEMTEDDDGSIWVSVDFYEYRLARISPLTGAWVFYKSPEIPFSETIEDMVFYNKKLYCIAGKGLYILDRQTGKWEYLNHKNSPIWESGANIIKFDPQGNLWVTKRWFNPNNNISHWLLKYDGAQWDTIVTNGASSTLDFAFSPEGTLWAINFFYPFYSRLLQKYNGSKFETVRTDVSNRLSFDFQGNILIEDEEKRVLKLDQQGNLLSFLSSCNSGLTGGGITDIELDKASGSIWFATDNGAARWQPSSALINPSFAIPSICAGETVTLQNQTIAANNYKWYVNDNLVATTSALTRKWQNPGLYRVRLEAYNKQGCAGVKNTVITVHPKADLSQLPKELIVCKAGTTLRAPGGMKTYRWMLAGKTVGTDSLLSVSQNGIYRIEVSDYCGEKATAEIRVSLGGCVWPGDVNRDYLVDNRDFALLAVYVGMSGPVRRVISDYWTAHPAPEWPNNLASMDTNGDGIIDWRDFGTVYKNHYKSNGPRPGLAQNQPSALHLVPVVSKVERTPDKKGRRITVDIHARYKGTDTLALAFAATAFSLEWVLPQNMKIDSLLPEVSFQKNGLGVEGVDMLTMYKVLPQYRRIEFAMARLDHKNQTLTNSLLVRSTFIISEINIPTGDTLHLGLRAIGAQIITNTGQFLPVDIESSTLRLLPETVITEETDTNVSLEVFPNPFNDHLSFHYKSSESDHFLLYLFDINGRLIEQQEVTGNNFSASFNTTGLPSGAYILCVQSGKAVLTRRVIKL